MNYALTIGCFDSLHRGHLYLLETLKQSADRLRLIPMVFLINTSSHKYTHSLSLNLLPINERHKKLIDMGFRVVFIDLNRYMSQWTYIQFFQYYINYSYDVSHIFVGSNFKFGFKREGTIAELKYLSYKHKKKLSIIDLLYDRGSIISTSIIKRNIYIGNIHFANDLLGYNYNFRGIIVKGIGIGGAYFLHTLNVLLKSQYFLPKYGTYTGYISILGMKAKAVIYIGYTQFTGRFTIEVYVTDNTINQKYYREFVDIIIYPFHFISDIKYGLKEKDMKDKILNEASTIINCDICNSSSD